MANKLRLELDPETLTIDDLVAIEQRDITASGVRDLLARFVLDDAGNKVEYEVALKTIGKMSIADTMRAAQALSVEVKKLIAAAIPPTTAAS